MLHALSWDQPARMIRSTEPGVPFGPDPTAGWEGGVGGGGRLFKLGIELMADVAGFSSRTHSQ